jgi:sporulation protein YlmC with PRC-barrel domain
MPASAEQQVDESIRYQDLKGVKILDIDGTKFGTLHELIINPSTLMVTGIIAHKGFNNNVLIHTDYIERISVDCVLLKMSSITKSMEVIDINRRTLGKVKDVFEGDANKIELIEVSTGLMGKSLKIPQHEIHGVGKKVILKHTKEEYMHCNLLTYQCLAEYFKTFIDLLFCYNQWRYYTYNFLTCRK